jgi:hypothetical protein
VKLRNSLRKQWNWSNIVIEVATTLERENKKAKDDSYTGITGKVDLYDSCNEAINLNERRKSHAGNFYAKNRGA